MTRLIDADELKNKFWHGDLVPNKEMYHISEIMYAIGNTPTIGEWFPVSEGLPKFSGLYLISIDSLVTVMNFSGTHFTNRGGVRVEVDAWQELPKPYKEEGEE